MDNKYYFSYSGQKGIIKANDDLECVQKLIKILFEKDETFIVHMMDFLDEMGVDLTDLNQVKEYE